MTEPTPVPADNPFARVPPTPDGLIATLCKRATTDQALLDHAQPAEIERALDRAVRVIWAESRVKVFVPVFALRAVREELGVDDAPAPAPAAARPLQRGAPARPRRGDELLLDPGDDLRV